MPTLLRRQRGTTSASPDQDLVRRAQAGDRAAFATLYERHGAAIARVAHSRLEAAAADDAVAETFIRAWRGLPRYRDTGKPFVAWLHGISRNVINDTHRANARTQPSSEIEPAAIADLADDEAARVDLARAIGQLPKKQQRVIELKYLVGMTNDEVAAELGMTAGAVNTMQWRGLQNLADLLGGER